jgi:hypothetical protein
MSKRSPAIFMVVIALLFHMILATVTQIDTVNRNFINVARTMGAPPDRRHRPWIRTEKLPSAAMAQLPFGGTPSSLCGIRGEVRFSSPIDRSASRARARRALLDGKWRPSIVPPIMTLDAVERFTVC